MLPCSEERRNLYQQSVDTWAFAAVMYHLMCGRPPFTGSGEGHGAAMLQTVMSHPVDYRRLTGAGISPEGVDFVQKMLVLEPSERATDAECLAHPWIIELTGAEKADEDMQGSEELPAIEEGVPGLDASQLSLQENPAPETADDGGEEEHLDADEIPQSHRSERLTSEYEYSRTAGLQLDESYASLPSYGTIPRMYNANNVRHDPGERAGNRLFGEIGNSALRSSGVLEPTAYAALDMTMNSSHDGSVSALSDGDDGMESNNDATDSHVTNNSQVAQNPPPPPHHPRHSNAFITSEPALSLLGTEAQIGQLNMASPESGHSMPSPETKPTTPKLPSSRDQSPSATAVTGSKRFGRDLESDTGHKAKRAKAHHSSANPRSRRSSADASSKQRPPSTGGHRVKDGQPSRHGSLPEPQPHQVASVEGAGNNQGQQPRETAQDAQIEAESSRAQEPHRQVPIVPGPQVITKRRKGSSNRSNSTSTSTIQDTPAPSAEFKVPRVPERPTLGKLSVVPGSLSGFVQKAKGAEKTIRDRQSKEFNEQFAINLKTRFLVFGRCEEEMIPYWEDPKADYTHITWPNSFDLRVGRKALQIDFWRPGIEADEAEGKDWVRPNDFWAIIASHSTAPIAVNGVSFTQAKDRFLYGRLYTGDIITFFDEQKPGKPAEFLKFECEFYRGMSKQRRPEGEPFTIEEERDKWRPTSRESSTASSKVAATAAGPADTTAPTITTTTERAT